MSDRLLLIDNDIFVLLAGAGLLEAAITTLGFSPAECLRLPALEPMLRKPAKVFEKYPAAVRTSALEACARISPLATTADLPDELIGATGIEDGEAVLFAKACESRCHYLASNDKRALRTLALAGPLSRIKSLMGGRIYCLEGVLKALLRDRSPKSLALAFAPLLPIDKRLQTILSSALSGSPEDCLVAAESFLAGLASELGPDFFAPLPP